MNPSKKLFSCALIFLLLVGATIFGYVQGLMSAPVLEAEDASSLPEPSSAAPETSSSEPSSLPASSEDPSSSLPEQSLEHSIIGTPEYIWRFSMDSPVDRPADWKQLVKNSPFKIGKRDGMAFFNFFKWGTYPHLNGSTVAVPMAIEFARQHLSLSDEHAYDLVSFHTTHPAYEYLIQKEKVSGGQYFDGNISSPLSYSPPDLIIVTEPSDEELLLAKRNNVTLVVKPVCCDAFVFITHKDNPIESLTIEQIQKIYSGEVTNWKEVGGADVPIIAYQREKNSGSQTAMENLVMQGKPMMNAPFVLIDSMGILIEAVADYQNRLSSIGYSYKYYVDNQYPDPNIKTIAIEGAEPNEKNIRSKAYPLSTNYYGVIRGGEEKEPGGKFLDWMLGPEGQTCIAQAGYIPINSSGAYPYSLSLPK